MTLSTTSPCIGICSTVYGDNVCRGCKRGYLEVINWNAYTDLEKQAINQRLEQQIETVVTQFVEIIDAQQLKAQLDQVILRPLLYANPFYWAYELLRLKAKRIDCLSACGLQAKPPYQMLTANGLFTQMDDGLYTAAKENLYPSNSATCSSNS